MKILYLIDVYQHKGGASYALFTLAEAVKSAGNDIAIYCRVLLPDSDTPQVLLQGNGKDVLDFYLDNNFQLIHWFKSGTIDLFAQLCRDIKRRKINVPIVTTVCQKPSYRHMLISPTEIEFSNKIVFIDKASLNDSYCQLISPIIKEIVYFGGCSSLIQSFVNKHVMSTNSIVFGRGSSENKWPKTMIDNYNKINISNKEFHIIGAASNCNWVSNYVRENKRTDIFVYEQLPFEKWIYHLCQMDIFLYQLPLDAYSSIDGTMQQAMLLEKPVVYYGPKAPKELIEHGISGFIAENENEIAVYAELLARDAALRSQMGRNARKRITDTFSFETTVCNYLKIYDDLTVNLSQKNHVTFAYWNFYLSRIYLYWLKFMLIAPFKIVRKIYCKIKWVA